MHGAGSEQLKLERDTLTARLTALVAARSLSREEGPAADLVSQWLAEAGLDVQRQGHNVWCTLGDVPRPRLLLNSHLDTVPAGNGWSGDPWRVREEDGRLVGLGANDAKGCVLAALTAAVRLHAELKAGRSLGGTIVLALTAEEEISGAGLGAILPQLGPIDAALVGEPTGVVPMIAQRGLLMLRGVARGRTAHPANTPAEVAENAIAKAARDLTALGGFDWGPPHPLLGKCHANVTMIQGGVARNVIPDECTFYLDIRTTPSESHADLLARLRAHMASELHVHSDRLGPMQTEAEATIVQAVRGALPDVVPGGSPAMSDMVYLRGIPSVKIGPGLSARSHTPDEFIRADELAGGVEAYGRIARAYFELAGRP